MNISLIFFILSILSFLGLTINFVQPTFSQYKDQNSCELNSVDLHDIGGSCGIWNGKKCIKGTVKGDAKNKECVSPFNYNIIFIPLGIIFLLISIFYIF
jgi:hypothetical protein